MTDPKRLSDQTDLPPQLEAALRLMGQNTTPPEVVDRVQRSLASLPSAGAAGGFPFGWGGAVSTVAIAATVAASVTWMRVQRDEASPQRVARAEQVTVGQPEPDARASPATSPAPEQQGAPEAIGLATLAGPPPTPRVATRAPAPRLAAQSVRRTPLKSAPGAETPVVAAAEPERSAVVQSNSARAPEQPAEAAAEAAEEVAEPSDAKDASTRPVVPQALAPEDEASLVYRAKRLALSDRAAAWGLIESHAQHFPNGALAEEREVLAIDVLHRMGREREAKARAARFLSHFPTSGYRSVVAKSAAISQ